MVNTPLSQPHPPAQLQAQATLPASIDDIRDEIRASVEAQLPGLVHQAVSQEEERRFRQIKWIVVFLGLIGLGTFGTLATFIVEKAVDAKAGSIKEALELTRINGLALKLRVEKSFSETERDEVVALLKRIAKIPALKSSAEVKLALGNILQRFTSAGQQAHIDEIFIAYQDEILVDGISTEVLLHHYGQQIVGRNAKPSTKDLALEAFEKLEGVATGHELMELALAYRVLYESLLGADERRIVNLLLTSLDFPENDSIRFLREILIRTKAENWQRRPTPEGRNFERVAKRFFKAYKNPLTEIYGNNPEIYLLISQEGVDDNQEEVMAQQLVQSGLQQRQVSGMRRQRRAS